MSTYYTGWLNSEHRAFDSLASNRRGFEMRFRWILKLLPHSPRQLPLGAREYQLYGYADTIKCWVRDRLIDLLTRIACKTHLTETNDKLTSQRDHFENVFENQFINKYTVIPERTTFSDFSKALSCAAKLILVIYTEEKKNCCSQNGK